MVDEPSPPKYRIAGLSEFLCLSQEASLSTRGQNLPQLIQSRSTSSFKDLRRVPTRKRRISAAGGSDDESHDENDLEIGRQSGVAGWGGGESDDRRMSHAASVLANPKMRSQRLIGNSNPRYKWEQYFKSEDELKHMRKPIREYYERNNYLIQQYMYIDRLLDSSLPHNLLQEYSQQNVHVPPTISEESPSLPATPFLDDSDRSPGASENHEGTNHNSVKIKRTPKNLYKVPDEDTPLLDNGDGGAKPSVPQYIPEDEADSGARIVTVAIYVNLVANSVLLVMKIVVIVLTSSLSVLASLVDAALDFLSTAIVWTTTRLISHQDQYAYPVGRRRLEPIGVLVFSVIMITSFFQVALEGINRLNSDNHSIVRLTIPAIAIMAATVVIKFLCWLWCRLIKNSSVQALAQDAVIDIVFNIFSIIFPLIGYYKKIWWLDAAGGVILSFYVIINWSRTSAGHIRNLTGAAASADERNILLYLTMRFAKTIRQIQGLQAYHAGDKLNVEVGIVLDENTSLRDSHDLGESLQYVLESVPNVDRAFVHLDYEPWNLPSHMSQQAD